MADGKRKTTTSTAVKRRYNEKDIYADCSVRAERDGGGVQSKVRGGGRISSADYQKSDRGVLVAVTKRGGKPSLFIYIRRALRWKSGHISN